MRLAGLKTIWITLALGAAASGTGCHHQNTLDMKFSDRQLTTAPYGHMLNTTQAFSKDGQWIVYDTRNDDARIGSTERIEMVHAVTGEVRVLYRTANQTKYGPGVGAATFSPTADRVLFIHGIRNADETKPYGMTRRTGVAVDTDRPGHPIFMDARDITPPFTPGALRGGTHAHTWSGDGQWVSFTYNDHVIEQLAQSDPSVQDLRMVGVMVPGTVQVPADGTLENNDGECFSVVVTAVTENPTPGSNGIDRAFDECWIGADGYVSPDGTRHRRAIAFQGNVRDREGRTVTELFVVDLPDALRNAAEGAPLEGTASTRPGVPTGVVQRRITRSASGVEGQPRHWLRSTPDGALICYLANDGDGVVQLFGISPNGGEPRQLTANAFSVQGPFNVDPSGQWVAYPADNSVFITQLFTGETHRLTPRAGEADRPIGAPNWSPDGKAIAYNRYVADGTDRYLQVFLLVAD